MRDTKIYYLKRKNKIVYIGISNDVNRRYQEHLKDKSFSTMTLQSDMLTRRSAEIRETALLAAYMKSHKGALPEYNKTKTGK